MKAISSVRATATRLRPQGIIVRSGNPCPKTGWWVPNIDGAIPIHVLSESLMPRMKNHQIEWNEAVQPEPILELGPPTVD
jgi:hypothetical protein